MLYLTTRNTRDAYRPYRALGEERGPCGGFFVPMQEPDYRESFSCDSCPDSKEWMARVLNDLWGTGFTACDMDFLLDKQPIRLLPIKHRVVIAETWHNSGRTFDSAVRSLAGRVRTFIGTQTPASWAYISARIAFLFGIFAELKKEGLLKPEECIDLSVPAGDFSEVISCWYARKWGLPVGNIICTCCRCSAVWDFLKHGQLHTEEFSQEEDPFLTENPIHLEDLISSCISRKEGIRYAAVCRKQGIYAPNPEIFETIRRGLYGSVVSRGRAEELLRSLCLSGEYFSGLHTALSYGGLLNFRAGKLQSVRTCVILSEYDPMTRREEMERILEADPEKFRNSSPDGRSPYGIIRNR